MAKKHDGSNGPVSTGGEYTCNQGKWMFVESHVGSLEIPTTGKQKVRVDKQTVLLSGKATNANPNGWRYWSRRVIPVLADGMSVGEWLDEIEKFDASDSLYIPSQEASSYHPKMNESRVSKNYRIMVDSKGSPISREQFEKLMLVGAVVLANQKALQTKMRERATEELYDELGIDRPVAGVRTKVAKADDSVPEDASEGLDS